MFRRRKKFTKFNYGAKKGKQFVKQPKAIAAKNYLESLVYDKIVDIKFSGFDKYGRALSTLYIKDPDSNKILCPNKLEVNTLMVRKGHGYSYMGGAKRNC